jgi:hypothetical protein
MNFVERVIAAFERVTALIDQRGLPPGGAAGQLLAKSSGGDRDAGWVAPGGGGGSSKLFGPATITPPPCAMFHTQTVVAFGVVTTNDLAMTIAPHDDTDENHELWLDPMLLTGRAGIDEITINATFSAPTSGPIKLNWSVL